MNIETRVLRTIFVPKRDEIRRGWRKVHHEELRNLCSAPYIIRIIKSSRMRWEGHGGTYGSEHEFLQDFGMEI
jgi:hypothetical protein